jgi:glycerol-3-phosphate dehydrogenase (NAD(P)+)
MRIAVLGAGSWGTTLAVLLSNKSHEVTLWSYSTSDAERIRFSRENTPYLPGIQIPPAISITSNLAEAFRGAEMVVAAVPSQFVRSVIAAVPPRSLGNSIIVNVAKGIEVGTLMTMSEVFLDVLPGFPATQIATMSGPSHAEEVSRSIPTTVVAASTSMETARAVQQAFMVPSFRVYAATDLRGVELGGALKNVIAIAAGIVEGAGLGDNTKAALMTRGIAEITRVGVRMGAELRTFGGLSGIGDLMVTCMSRHSRNRHVGMEIGRGRLLKDVLGDMVMVAEGVETTRSARELARRAGVEVPIINEVYNILFDEKEPLRACYDLMTRDPKGEA